MAICILLVHLHTLKLINFATKCDQIIWKIG